MWCPKYRCKVLGGRVKTRLGELVWVRCAEHGWQIVALEIMPDQVRLFVKARPKDFPSYVANQLKGMTSHMLRRESAHLRSKLPTLWSRSYFAATVGSLGAATVQRYIETQYERVLKKVAAS